MLRTFAVSNYRSLRELRLSPQPLTVITGANGCGKSNLYRALRMLQHAADGTLAEALANEGGTSSVQWAGPADARSQHRRGLKAQGTARREPLRIAFGVATDDWAYELALGISAGGNPVLEGSRFKLDPEIKSEYVWHAPPRRRANTWLERDGQRVSLRDGDGAWTVLGYSPSTSRSVLSQIGEPERFPELLAVRETFRRWRFYDGFRTDAESPLRQPRVSVQTEALAGDGRDLAAALQTIVEIGDADALADAIADAFEGSQLAILGDDARLQVGLSVDGLLRPLTAAELSDGTLRYFCLLAALLSPRPPPLLVLNEPEQSLHPDLLLPLARQIVATAKRTQVWVISHAPALVRAISDVGRQDALVLVRQAGETRVQGQGLLDEPVWP